MNTCQSLNHNKLIVFSKGKEMVANIVFFLTESDHSERVKHQTDDEANDGHQHRCQASGVVTFHADLFLNIPQCRTSRVNSSHSGD